MKLTIGTGTEEIGEVESIRLSKGTDGNWRLYLKEKGSMKTRHFNLDKVLRIENARNQTKQNREVTAKS